MAKPKSMERDFDKKLHFRHCLLYEFKRGASAAAAARNICAVYPEASINERTAQRWFARFKKDNFDLGDKPHVGRASIFDEDRLNALIHEDPRQTTRELAEKMGCDHSTIARHLQAIGKVQKYGIWVPYIHQQDTVQNKISLKTTKSSAPPLQSLCSPSNNNLS